MTAGKHYRFRAYRKTTYVATPRKTGLARVTWLDAKGNRVTEDRPLTTGYLVGGKTTAETEYPTDGPADAKGWTEVAGTYRVPAGAAQARVELYLVWAANARVEWSDVALDLTDPPAPRKVKLATVHFRRRGRRRPSGGRRSAR